MFLVFLSFSNAVWLHFYTSCLPWTLVHCLLLLGLVNIFFFACLWKIISACINVFPQMASNFDFSCSLFCSFAFKNRSLWVSCLTTIQGVWSINLLKANNYYPFFFFFFFFFYFYFFLFLFLFLFLWVEVREVDCFWGSPSPYNFCWKLSCCSIWLYPILLGNCLN